MDKATKHSTPDPPRPGAKASQIDELERETAGCGPEGSERNGVSGTEGGRSVQLCPPARDGTTGGRQAEDSHGQIQIQSQSEADSEATSEPRSNVKADPDPRAPT